VSCRPAAIELGWTEPLSGNRCGVSITPECRFRTLARSASKGKPSLALRASEYLFCGGNSFASIRSHHILPKRVIGKQQGGRFSGMGPPSQPRSCRQRGPCPVPLHAGCVSWRSTRRYSNCGHLRCATQFGGQAGFRPCGWVSTRRLLGSGDPARPAAVCGGTFLLCLSVPVSRLRGACGGAIAVRGRSYTTASYRIRWPDFQCTSGSNSGPRFWARAWITQVLLGTFSSSPRFPFIKRRVAVGVLIDRMRNHQPRRTAAGALRDHMGACEQAVGVRANACAAFPAPHSLPACRPTANQGRPATAKEMPIQACGQADTPPHFQSYRARAPVRLSLTAWIAFHVDRVGSITRRGRDPRINQSSAFPRKQRHKTCLPVLTRCLRIEVAF
jgi:hypothetical protein